MNKELYKGDSVIVRKPGDIRAIDGCLGGFCECGCTLHIKMPKQKAFHSIECPVCGCVINVFGGEEGESASMDDIRDAISTVLY